jgi:DNA helicase-2/ATP-dependent DNA helicase PcrA
VAFTFTDKAAQGMKSRIYDRFKDLGRDDLRARIGDFYVGTSKAIAIGLLPTISTKATMIHSTKTRRGSS